MRPPKGFDLWFAFASKNNVQLLDEYDNIHKSILPFLSLPHETLMARQAVISESPQTHTIHVRNGQLSLSGAKKDLKRASEQVELMQAFAQWLPDLDIVMSAHDGPAVLLDHKLKTDHETAARAGTKLSVARVEELNDDPAYACLSCPIH